MLRDERVVQMTSHSNNSPQSWSYSDIESSALPSDIEEHFLAPLRKLTTSLDVQGVCEAVLTGVERAFGATSS